MHAIGGKWLPRLPLVGLLLVIGFLKVGLCRGEPLSYELSDTVGLWGVSPGAGVFTLDLGPSFGVYYGTEVSGGPGTLFGTWAGVELEVGRMYVLARFS